MGLWFLSHRPALARQYLFCVGIAALVPLLMPSMPHKKWNALFLLIVFPLMALILLTGGHFALSYSAFASVASLLAMAAALLPISVLGIEEGIKSAKWGLGLWRWSGILVLFVGFRWCQLPIGAYSTGQADFALMHICWRWLGHFTDAWPSITSQSQSSFGAG